MSPALTFCGCLMGPERQKWNPATNMAEDDRAAKTIAYELYVVRNGYSRKADAE